MTQQDCLTLTIAPEKLLTIAQSLRDDFQFDILVDVCGVDYQDYGKSYWRTHETTESGFSRGVSDHAVATRFTTIAQTHSVTGTQPHTRFASVYHLLSTTHNQRIRLKVFLAENMIVPSVIDLWKSADWYEREAFDLFGIIYEGHPDLRRLLTDYGFKGHPFLKDFPLIGEVEMRYDAATKRCVYEPVSIESRTLVPKVIRDDNRYTS